MGIVDSYSQPLLSFKQRCRDSCFTRSPFKSKGEMTESQLKAPRNGFAELFTANSVETKGSIDCLINYQLVFANSENHSCALRHD